jgi:hypothetical protein
MKVPTVMFILWVSGQKSYLHPGFPFGDLLILYEMFYIDAALSEFESLNMWSIAFLCAQLWVHAFMQAWMRDNVASSSRNIKVLLFGSYKKSSFNYTYFPSIFFEIYITPFSFCCCKSCNRALKIISLI